MVYYSARVSLAGRRGAARAACARLPRELGAREARMAGIPGSHGEGADREPCEDDAVAYCERLTSLCDSNFVTSAGGEARRGARCPPRAGRSCTPRVDALWRARARRYMRGALRFRGSACRSPAAFSRCSQTANHSFQIDLIIRCYAIFHDIEYVALLCVHSMWLI